MILLLVLVVATGAVPAAASPDHPSATFFSEFAALVGGHRVDAGFRIQDLTVSVRLRSGDPSVRVDYHFLGEVVAELVADVTDWAFLPPERLLGVTVDGEPVAVTETLCGDGTPGYTLGLASLSKPLVRGRRFDCRVQTAYEVPGDTPPGEAGAMLDLQVRLCELFALLREPEGGVFRVFVTVPRGWGAFWSGGELPPDGEGDGTTFAWLAAVRPFYNYPLAVGPFHTLDVGLPGVALHVLEEDLASKERLCAIVRDTVSRARAVAAEFDLPPLSELDAVLFRRTGARLSGKGPCGLVLLEVGRDVPAALDLLPALLSHEVLHQWFPGKVVFDRPTSFWITEGMTAYFDIRYMHNGWPPFRAGFPYPNRYVPLSYSIEEVCSDGQLLRQNAGQALHLRGSWVVHMLRGLIGERAFRETVREFYGDTSGRPVGTAEFQAMAEKHSGMDLGWFFDQWLRTARTPRMKLVDLRVSRRGGEWTVHGAVSDAGDAVLPPVEVAAYREGEKIAATRVVLPPPDSRAGVRRAEFTLVVPALTSRVVLDPDSWIPNAETTGLSCSLPVLLLRQVGPWAGGLFLVGVAVALVVTRRRGKASGCPSSTLGAGSE
ncbi:MAG: M1 family aminopeptidase [Bacillota bacterium]|nr:M1 family aminopeptidase [Bacillota bacterium]